MAISVIICAYFFLSAPKEFETTAGMMEAPEATDWIINLCYAFIGLACIATVVFVLISFISQVLFNPKSVLVPVVAIVALAVLMISTYFGADVTPINIIGYEGSQEPFIYQITNMCMVTSAVLGGIAVFVTLFGFLIKKLF